VTPLTRAIPERIGVVTTMRYTNRRLLYFILISAALVCKHQNPALVGYIK